MQVSLFRQPGACSQLYCMQDTSAAIALDQQGREACVWTTAQVESQTLFMNKAYSRRALANEQVGNAYAALEDADQSKDAAVVGPDCRCLLSNPLAIA